MAEDATRQDAPDVSGATPASADQTAAQTGAQPQPQPDPGHVSGEDFNHPVYGPKLKNLMKGLEEKGKTANEAKAELDKMNSSLQALREFYANNPDLHQAMIARVQGRAATPEQSTPNEDESDEDRARRELREQIRAEYEADMALNNTYISLGQGDPVKGKKLWAEKYHGGVSQILKQISDGSPEDKLTIALEILRTREAEKNKAAQPAPAVTPPAEGTTNADFSRGTGTPAPEKEPETDDEIVEATLKGMGFRSVADYIEKTGGLGR